MLITCYVQADFLLDMLVTFRISSPLARTKEMNLIFLTNDANWTLIKRFVKVKMLSGTPPPITKFISHQLNKYLTQMDLQKSILIIHPTPAIAIFWQAQIYSKSLLYTRSLYQLLKSGRLGEDLKTIKVHV